METMIHAFESRTGAAARSARKRTGQYVEGAPQLASRFWTKSLTDEGRLCWARQKGGA